MSRPRPEFSRLVSVARLGAEPFRQEIAATEEERIALARRFDLLAIERLEASVELVPNARGSILLRAAFDAAFVQSCVVTLDPVPGAVSERFKLVYGPPEAEDNAAAAEDDAAFEPLNAEVIDIGEAVAQEFSLALPPFPRSPDAMIEAEEPLHGNASPFAALSRLSGQGSNQ